VTFDDIEPFLRETATNPYRPKNISRHAGKVFVIPLTVVRAAGVVASDGTDPAVIGDRLLLCLWDVLDGRSIWLELQSNGEYSIPHQAKYLAAGSDPNWMNPAKVSCYRNDTIWRLGRPNVPFTYRQTQQRGVKIDELDNIRSRISHESIRRLLV
jgi:hypothetical protein